MAPLVTCPIENRMTNKPQEKINSATETPVLLKNLKSTKLSPKNKDIEMMIQMNCFKKKFPSPVKEFIVIKPAPRRGNTAKKSIQSIPFSSFSF
jgi:hypothetical protein